MTAHVFLGTSVHMEDNFNLIQTRPYTCISKIGSEFDEIITPDHEL